MHNKVTDSVSNLSFAFDVFQAGIKSSEEKLNRWGLTYFTRSDAYPSGGRPAEVGQEPEHQSLGRTG